MYSFHHLQIKFAFLYVVVCTKQYSFCKYSKIPPLIFTIHSAAQMHVYIPLMKWDNVLKLYFVFGWTIYPLTSWAVSLRDWLAVDMMDCRGSFLLVSEIPPLPCDCLSYGWETDLEMEEKWLTCILKLCTVLVLYGLQWNWDLKIYLYLVVMYRLQTKYYCIFTLLSY